MSDMMGEKGIHSSNWYHAITLAERITSLRALDGGSDGAAVDFDLAKRRISQWRSQQPFTMDARFSQRVALDEITEDEFLHLLGEPAESIQKRFSAPPRWLEEFESAFSTFPASSLLSFPASSASGKDVAFIEAVEPLIRRGRDRLRKGINALVQFRSDLPFDPETIEEVLYVNLPRQLLLRLSRTFVLELHVARLEGVLKGSTSEERFLSFMERLRQPGVILGLLAEYPVLARLLVTCIDQWVNFGLSFLEHLLSDWEALRTTFEIETNPGVLVEVNGGSGDRHRGGRSVLLLRFSSGLRLVYKPRSLAIDSHFQELLNWLNQRGNHPPFRTSKVLDRMSHGWMEFVHAASCTSPDEVHRFYERIGGYLAVLYALEATDFHYENLVAAGEDPMLIDLETLFSPSVQRERTQAEADLLAADVIQASVLRVMLLPQRLWNTGDSEGVDFSGLANSAGQLTPFAVPLWEREATDEMRLTRKRLAMSGEKNTPTLNGNHVPVLEYVDAIEDGFTSIYHLLEKHCNELISDNGPLAAFANDEIRVVLRPTQTYGSLLMESYHPDSLRNALDRDRLFDRLWIYVEHLPHLSRVIAHEKEDMHRGDIPRFTTQPNSRDLWSNANQPIRNILDESGMTMVQRRIQRLSDNDLSKQLWFIRASFATMPSAAGRRREAIVQDTVMDRERAKRRPDRPTPQELVTAARALGDRLSTLAVHGEDDVTWIGLNYMNEGNAAVKPLDRDLYDGISGVALFLAYLGAMTGEGRFTTLAQRAMTNVLRGIEGDRSGSRSTLPLTGAFCGWGGVIYTLTHLSSLWAKPALVDEAEKLVGLLPALIDQLEELDIIGGAAGCIGALLALYRAAPSDRTLAAAVRCGNRLRDGIQLNKQAELLTGFSHGAAGMAWALLELASVAGEERFRGTALELIEWERSLFNTEKKNWPDLRDRQSPGLPAGPSGTGEPGFCVAWCHGAPGIGLARLRSLPHLDDAQTRAEIDAALETTLTQGFGLNHSLCHGDLGNIELLVYASRRLDPRWEVEAGRLASTILDGIQARGWLCGVPLEVETPGLMTGLAGIGYELLRLADPIRVPSVLALEGPTLVKGRA
jgi:type 2 lantibiotic biosynthesis protein LanM